MSQSSNVPDLFQYGTCDVRTVMIGTEIWFVAQDVCCALDIVNSRDAVSSLDEGEVGSTDLIDSLDRNRCFLISIINKIRL